MSRIMNRPMFRKGGSAGEGITSGLRQGYETAGDVKQNDLSKIDLRNMDMQQIKDLAVLTDNLYLLNRMELLELQIKEEILKAKIETLNDKL